SMAPRKAVAASRPTSHAHRSQPTVRVIGTTRVASASPRHAHAKTAGNGTFQAGIRFSCKTEINGGREVRSERRERVPGRHHECTEDLYKIPDFGFDCDVQSGADKEKP